jgi:hypothetical protein
MSEIIYACDISKECLMSYKYVLESLPSLQDKIVNIHSITLTNNLPDVIIVGFYYEGQLTKAHQYVNIHKSDIRDYKLNIILN